MYMPPAFQVEDRERALALIDRHPFATLVAPSVSPPFVNHLPLLLVKDESGTEKLVGHMARKNPQWRIFQTDPAVLAIFHGPHAYVTPSWYEEHDVPTWNYAVAHVSGRVRLIEDFKGLVTILGKMTARFEAGAANPWRFSLPDDLKTEKDLTGAIVGIEIVDWQMQAKFKLGQNRSQADQAGVRRGLEARGDESSLKVLELMRSGR